MVLADSAEAAEGVAAVAGVRPSSLRPAPPTPDASGATLETVVRFVELVLPLRSGAKTIVIRLPAAMRGIISILLKGAKVSLICRNVLSPNSRWAISRPRNCIVNWTLWPSVRNCFAFSVLIKRSWSSILGRKRTSFSSLCLLWLRAFCSFFFCWYFHLP